MLKSISKKIIYGVFVLWGVVTLVFFLYNILPGDPARMMLGQRADLNTLESIRKEMGLDQTVGRQYVHYLNDLSPLSVYQVDDQSHYFYFDDSKYSTALNLISTKHWSLLIKSPYLGTSFQNQRSVSSMIAGVLPATFLLAFVAMFIATVFGIFLGVLCALRKDSFFDRATILVTTIGVSLPSFFTAILIGWICAFLLSDITHLNLTGNIFEIDDFGKGKVLVLKNLLLPAITLGIRPLSIITQLSRNALLDVLGQDYIRTAKAKGLSFRKIIAKHALRNSMNPIVTAVSGWFASLMAGVVFVEYIFGWRGLGNLIVNALNQYDMPLVLGAVITIASIFVMLNILVDISYGLLDPRVRRESA